jgi:hypothetical protein
VPPKPVDFEFARAPSYRVVALAWTGPWNDRKIRSQFERLAAWARAHRLRTGRWFMREPGNRKWEVAIEVGGRARGDGTVRAKTYRAAPVARCVFDPERVSPRVVYHGLTDWLRWRRREKKFRAVVGSREVYTGNPWTDARAWARTEVQFLLRR